MARAEEGYGYIKVVDLVNILDQLEDTDELMVNQVGNLSVYRQVSPYAQTENPIFDFVAYIELRDEELVYVQGNEAIQQ